MKPRVLFILKYRETYDDNGGGTYSCDTGKGLSSGLSNSAKFVVDMLAAKHVEVKLVQVIDNNEIDREVHIYNPTHVVVEALWVVPEKFDILQRLHPRVKWIVRGHSELPFLANEGVAIDWLTRYMRYKNVYIAANSERSLRDLRQIIQSANPLWNRKQVDAKVVYLPNYYPYHKKHGQHQHRDCGFLDVGCFGAIRPLKNQLIQAVAAIRYAESRDKQLRFHINSGRNEQGGDRVLKNLRALFHATGHDLVEHGWLDHHEFLHLLMSMDMLLQVSFSETFNIVAADASVTGLPIVVSPEIHWAHPRSMAEPTDSDSIVKAMKTANDWRFRWVLKVLNLRGLGRYCERSKHHWLRYLHA